MHATMCRCVSSATTASNCAALTQLLRILLLLTHALTGKLGKLYQMIDMRLACFTKFLDLSGRLDIVLSNVPTAQAGAEVHARPSSVYVESDESDDDDDDEDADSDDNNSDNDNDDNVEGDSDAG
jgi:hypothetical protein